MVSSTPNADHSDTPVAVETAAKKIRVLHIIPGLGHGGAEHQLLMNVQWLDRTRFDSHVCHLLPRTILQPEFEEAGATVHSISTTGFGSGARKLWKMIRLIRQIKPDVIHTSVFEADVIGGLAGRLTGTPVVGTSTNTAYEPVWLVDNAHLTPWKLRLVTRFRTFLYKRTHRRYIAISEHVKESVVREMGGRGDKFDIIYRGMKPDFAEIPEADIAAVREDLELDGRSPVILNVGRLMPQKGQRYLVDAMAQVVAKHPDALLLIAGVGNLEDKLRARVVELGIEKNVNFLGRRDDIPTLLKAVDIFAFTSLFEGLGVALLEACAAGKAVVASKTGPIPEVVEDGESGLLAPITDVDAIASSILKLADDPELRAKFGAAARAKIEEKFMINKSIKLLEEFYVKTLAS